MAGLVASEGGAPPTPPAAAAATNDDGTTTCAVCMSDLAPAECSTNSCGHAVSTVACCCTATSPRRWSPAL